MAKQRGSGYWFKNEKKVLKKIGLTPVPGSGSGELHKEDGENEHILCQLKSTEQGSATIRRKDVETLLYHSELVNKIPLFVIQFMEGPMLIATVPEELGNIAQYLNEELFERKQLEIHEIPKQEKKKLIKSKEVPLEDFRQELRKPMDKKEKKELSFMEQAMEKRKIRNEKR